MNHATACCTGEKQLVGQRCHKCEHRIAAAIDARWCSECSKPVHMDCLQAGEDTVACPTCGCPKALMLPPDFVGEIHSVLTTNSQSGLNNAKSQCTHAADEWQLKSIWHGPLSFVLFCLAAGIATLGPAAVGVFVFGYLFPIVFRSTFGERMPIWGMVPVLAYLMAGVILAAAPIYLGMLVAGVRKGLCYK